MAVKGCRKPPVITQIVAQILRLPQVDGTKGDSGQDTLVVRVVTDCGLVGIGEVEAQPEIAKAVIDAPRSWGDLGTLTFDVEDPVVQLVDSSNGEILYTIRVNGKTFTPKAPLGRAFTVKAGRDEPGKVVSEKAKVGSAPQKITL